MKWSPNFECHGSFRSPWIRQGASATAKFDSALNGIALAAGKARL
jgi:hypothetical protein